MAVLGLLSGAGHLMLIRAFRRAPSAIVAPFHYSQMIWAVIFGLFLFDDIPDSMGDLRLRRHYRQRPVHPLARDGAGSPGASALSCAKEPCWLCFIEFRDYPVSPRPFKRRTGCTLIAKSRRQFPERRDSGSYSEVLHQGQRVESDAFLV